MIAKLKEHWYEILLFTVALGTTELVYEKMGANNPWLYGPILAAEIILATAAIDGAIGLIAAFLASALIVGAVYLDPMFIKAYFPMMVFLGSVRLWMARRQKALSHTKAFIVKSADDGNPQSQSEHPVPSFNAKGQLDPKPWVGQPVRVLREVFMLSHNKCKELQNTLSEGNTVTREWLESNRKPLMPLPAV